MRPPSDGPTDRASGNSALRDNRSDWQPKRAGPVYGGVRRVAPRRPSSSPTAVFLKSRRVTQDSAMLSGVLEFDFGLHNVYSRLIQ